MGCSMGVREGRGWKDYVGGGGHGIPIPAFTTQPPPQSLRNQGNTPQSPVPIPRDAMNGDCEGSMEWQALSVSPTPGTMISRK